MRLTREELLKMHPFWNEEKHDIVKIFYAEEPLVIYDIEAYKRYCELPSGTLQNIATLGAYIFSNNGDYKLYRCLIGEVYIKADGTVLCGDINVKYKGGSWNIYLNKMYGKDGLTIMKLSGTVTGFANKDGNGSPCLKKHTKEADSKVIEKIIEHPLEDFGVGVQAFMKEVREIYYTDNTNHILEKCWGG